jgi:hypothetical protein
MIPLLPQDAKIILQLEHNLSPNVAAMKVADDETSVNLRLSEGCPKAAKCNPKTRLPSIERQLVRPLLMKP